ncbi:MAG: ParA family protein [Deltaproteobacteria bacterium]|nr:MAG: ParA family protein [Deltaproteobacteria bacterium]
MTRIISITNQKGGVGKTTTAVNLAACLAALHFRTLLIDLDPQGNATSGVGLDPRELDHSAYHLLCADVPPAEIVRPSGIEHLDIIPANADLAGAEVELVVAMGREGVLRRALADFAPQYDYILIDCPPSLGLLTVNALAASRSVLVPIQAEYYALEGMARLLDTIERIRFNLNPDLRLEGMLVTMHDGRNNLSRQVEDEVRQHFPAQTYETVIPRNVRLSESPSHGQPIIMYDIESRGARSYLALAREFIARHAEDTAQP